MASPTIPPSRMTRRTGLSTGVRLPSSTMRKISSTGRPVASASVQPVSRSATALRNVTWPSPSVARTASPMLRRVVLSRCSLCRNASCDRTRASRSRRTTATNAPKRTRDARPPAIAAAMTRREAAAACRERSARSPASSLRIAARDERIRSIVFRPKPVRTVCRAAVRSPEEKRRTVSASSPSLASTRAPKSSRRFCHAGRRAESARSLGRWSRTAVTPRSYVPR